MSDLLKWILAVGAIGLFCWGYVDGLDRDEHVYVAPDPAVRQQNIEAQGGFHSQRYWE
ncbi:MAG: hypothetical protein ACOYBJ_02180 [Patescibacteria group bacterium]|jgi:hypothetical protein